MADTPAGMDVNTMAKRKITPREGLNNSVTADLSDTLKEVIRAIISRAADGGVRELPRRKYTVEWYEPTSPGAAKGESEEREEPSFGLFEMSQHLGVNWVNEQLEPLTKEAAEFAKSQGRQLKFLDPSGTFGRTMVFEYFLRAGKLEIDDAAIKGVVTEFVDSLRSEAFTNRAVFQVTKFDADAPFSLSSEVSFRRVNEDDIDEFGRVPEFREMRYTRLNKLDWICTVERRLPKDEAVAFGEDYVEDIAVALDLTTGQSCDFQLMVEYITSPYLSCGRMAGRFPMQTSPIPGPVHLAQSDVNLFQHRFLQVCGVQEKDSLKYLRLPLRRLRAACSRTASEDKLIDLVVALEMLLASDSPALETTYRFKLRGAALLPEKEFGNARKRLILLKKLYELRSNVVHGKGKVDDLQDSVRDAHKVLRHVLTWYLDRVDSLASLTKAIEKIDDAMVGVFNESP